MNEATLIVEVLTFGNAWNFVPEITVIVPGAVLVSWNDAAGTPEPDVMLAETMYAPCVLFASSAGLSPGRWRWW